MGLAVQGLGFSGYRNVPGGCFSISHGVCRGWGWGAGEGGKGSLRGFEWGFELGKGGRALRLGCWGLGFNGVDVGSLGCRWVRGGGRVGVMVCRWC